MDLKRRDPRRHPSDDSPQAVPAWTAPWKTTQHHITELTPTMSPIVKVTTFFLRLPLGPGTSDVSILGDNTQTIPSRMTRTRDALQMPRIRYVLATIPTTLPNRMVAKARVVIGTVVGRAYHEEPSPWSAAVIESTGNEDAGSGWPEGLEEHSFDFREPTKEEKEGS